jgi:uncharacterized membrane protein
MGNSASDSATRVRRAITVNAPVDAIYRFWRDFTNLPRFMRHLESVVETAPGRSHWIAASVDDHTIEWDANGLQDIPRQNR